MTSKEFDSKMIDLFKLDLESQIKIISDGLVALEQPVVSSEEFQNLMRAAHSIKGAARAIFLDSISLLAHALEDFFLAAQEKKISMESESIDLIFQAVDLLTRLSHTPSKAFELWITQEKNTIEKLLGNINAVISGKPLPSSQIMETPTILEPPTVLESPVLEPEKPVQIQTVVTDAMDTSLKRQQKSEQERVLRVSAQSLNRLMGLAGESMVEARWLLPFNNALLKLKKSHSELSSILDQLREELKEQELSEEAAQIFSRLQNKSNECRQNLSDRLAELDRFISRHSSLTDRLYSEVIESQMRPFADVIESFPRMVRDLAKQLNKKVKLEIHGKQTSVDRDILQKLESPLSHLLRNAIDHGIELPSIRKALGKPQEATIRLEARHRAGMLAITISDDGQGVDLELIRKKIVEKNLVKEDVAAKLREQELFEFLLLPGFSTASQVTEISGRGMGLNIVQNLIQEVAGNLRLINTPSEGLTIHLQLPLTLSVIRALIVNIQGEPYAFPLPRIDRTLLIPKEKIDLFENRQYFNFEGQNIGLVPASQVLELGDFATASKIISIIVLNDRSNYYGLVVDSFLGEKELVVHELDSRLGKIPNISAGSFLENGEPILIVDVEDVMRSIDLLLSGGRLHQLTYKEERATEKRTKRILVVDDSLTVREVECRLLRNQGYEVESAINGVDAWNAIRIGNYDLVVTDVDMPRMNGIELVKAIKNDPRLKSLPIMIVSYKERESDRLLGLEAGANYYLTKSSFHDESLINAVVDLIGKPII